MAEPCPDLAVDVPRVRRGSIERRRLLDRLARTSHEHVIAVTAPAGFGKTTLLAQWAAADPRPAGWLSIEPQDNDAVELLRRLGGAVGGGPAELAEDPVLGPVERRLAGLVVRGLAGHRDGFLLVIDDVHRLVDPAARETIDWLVRSLPEGCQVALGSRIEPWLPLERWRAEGRLVTLGPDDLALDRAECAALLGAVGIGTEAEAEAIRERTGGWAAGVYLLGRLVAEAPPDARPGALDLPRTEISDYVVRQVLSALAPDDRRLLVVTSMFDRLTGALCDAVTGSTGAAPRLDALARDLWFVQPLDPERRWFRCHGLLREALLRELRELPQGQIDGLHRAAAGWYREQGEVVLAVDHLFLAGDRAGAARLIAANTQRLHARGAKATLQRWYAQLDADDLEANPSVAATAAWMAALDGNGVAFERWLASFEAADRSGTPGDGTTSFDSSLGMLRALDCRDGPEQMLRDATAAAEGEPPWSAWWSTATLLQGHGFLMLGEAADAARCFREITSSPSAQRGAWCVAVAEQALGAVRDRDWRGAEDLIRSFRRVVAEAGMGDYVTSLLGFVVDARIRLHRGDTARAQTVLMEAQMLRRLASWAAPWHSVRALVELARCQLLAGDVAGARACVAQIDDILERRPRLGALVGAAGAVREQAQARVRLTGATTLTPAELRLLPLLQTYLTFREIGDHLGVSHNTVKTQAVSIYAKLGVTSRSEAIELAVDSGLLVPIFERIGSDRSRV